MAIFEVTIQGSAIDSFMEEDEKPCSYLTEDSYTFTWEGRDLIETMMSVQALLDVLNVALKAKYPDSYKDDLDWEYRISGVCKTDMIRFTETWIKEFVEHGVVSRDYEEDE